MKKGLVMLGVVLLVFIPIALAPMWYGSGDDSGLVGKWSCEGNFLDSSGQGFNGTPYSGASIGTGAKGRGCNFNGGNYVKSSSSATLDVTSTRNMSFSFWIKSGDYSTAQFILAKRHPCSNTGQYTIWIGGNNIKLASYRNATQNVAYSTNNTTLHNGSWHHIVLTKEWNISNGMKFYIDGNAWTDYYISGDDTTQQSTYTGLYLFFGTQYATCPAESYTYNFTGILDEIRIYNRSLSAAEAYSLYNTSKTYYFTLKTTPVLGGLNDTPTPTASDETGLVGHWKLDGDATDSSSLGNNGVVSGATSTSDGRWNQAYQFNGLNTFINVSQPTLNLSNATLTISAWIKPNVTNSWTQASVVGRTDFSGLTSNNQFKLGLTNTGLARVDIFYNSTSYAGVAGTSTLSIGKWSHIVGTYDNQNVKVYVNGVLETTYAWTSPMPDKYANIMIGLEPSNARYFNGTIDEVRIYNRSLSADEVRALYLSKGLVGHWKMNREDGSTNITAIDSSGYGNHATISGISIKFTNEGKFKEAYNFNAGGNAFVIPNKQEYLFNTSTDITVPNSSFTLSAWVNPRSFKTTSYDMIMNRQTANDPSGCGMLWGISGGYSNDVAYMFTDTTGGPLCQSFASVGSIPLNAWTLVTYTFGPYNTTDSVGKIYLNGRYDNIKYMKGGLDVNNTSSYTPYVGYLGSSHQFNGSIDEVRIYNRELTATEVGHLYNGTKTNYFVLKTDPVLGGLNDTPAPTINDETNLLGYWKLDNNLNDNSGNGNTGTIIGTSASTEGGRWNQAYSFNGGSNAINITNPLKNYTAMSISLWAKFDSGDYKHLYGPDATNFRLFWNFSGTLNNFYVAFPNGTGLAGGYTGSETVLTNKWYHLVATDNGTHVNLYQDGTNIYSTAFNYHTIASDGMNWIFGCRNSLSNCFNGTIDEVRVYYNRSLSATEVKELYLSKGLVGKWTFNANEKNSTHYYDSSGYSHHEQAYLSPTYTNQGKFKEAVKFNGVSYLSTTTDDYISNESTWSYWIKKDGTAGSEYALYYGVSSADRFMIYNQADGFSLYDDINNEGEGTSFCTYCLNSGWNHLALVFHSNGTKTGYLNGIDKGTHTTGASLINISTGATFNIGSQITGNNPVNGTIDEVRVYNRALTESEILQLYNGTKTNYFTLKTVAG